jgi:hypothetical protein
VKAKTLIMIFMTAGSTLGSLLPALWGASWLSFASVLLGGVGGAVGIWVGYKISRM